MRQDLLYASTKINLKMIRFLLAIVAVITIMSVARCEEAEDANHDITPDHHSLGALCILKKSGPLMPFCKQLGFSHNEGEDANHHYGYGRRWGGFGHGWARSRYGRFFHDEVADS